MLRPLVLSTLLAFALAPSAHAGMVQVNFSGGGGAPLTISLPQAVSYIVTNNTANPSAIFVFQGVGNATGNTVRAVTGTLSYTTNGGAALPIDGAGTFPVGVVTSNDLSLFKNSSPGVGLNDVLLLSGGFVTTSSNVTAAAPPSGLYSAILVDNAGVQLGVGTAVPEPASLGLAGLAGLVLLRRSRRGVGVIR